MVKPKCVVALGLPSDMIDTLGDAYDVSVWPESQPMPEAVLQDWRPHVLPWQHEMVFDEPEEEDELEDSERR